MSIKDKISKISSEHKCRRGIDFNGELDGIRNLVSSAKLLMSVRREVSRLGMSGLTIIDGKHCDATGYEAVIRHNGNSESIARRIKTSSIGDSIQIERIADNMLGINNKR